MRAMPGLGGGKGERDCATRQWPSNVTQQVKPACIGTHLLAADACGMRGWACRREKKTWHNLKRMVQPQWTTHTQTQPSGPPGNGWKKIGKLGRC